jgi:hypothetical protein
MKIITWEKGGGNLAWEDLGLLQLRHVTLGRPQSPSEAVFSALSTSAM